LGRFSDAADLFRKALGVRELTLPADSALIAESLNNLAATIQSGLVATSGIVDHNNEIEPLYLRALAIQKKALGTEHIRVAQTINSIGMLYTVEGRFAEAEDFARQGLEMRAKLLPPNHPGIAVSLNSLGWLYFRQSKYSEAAAFFAQALNIGE